MARGKPPTTEELPSLIGDVGYELEMFDHAVARWAGMKEQGVSTREEQLDEFAWMELSMLHARNLCAFFSGKDTPAEELTCSACNTTVVCSACSNRIANNDDVFAIDWLDDWGTSDEKATVKKLRGVMAKLNKWLMHVTASRSRDRAKQPAWSPIETQQDVHALWSQFQTRLNPPTTWRAPQPTRRLSGLTSTTTSSTSDSVIFIGAGIEPPRR